jgi:PIN domain nuclease of toxin-antitoxin system
MAAGNEAVNHYVADTHALFWYLTASPRLGPQVRQAFDEGVRGQAVIYVSAIVLAELYFLNEKAGRPLDFAAEYARLRQSGQFIFVPFEPEDVLDFETDTTVSEMHDRIIVGLARRMGATCLSLDPQIAQSGLVDTIW